MNAVAAVGDVAELIERLKAVTPYQGRSKVPFLCHEAADHLAALQQRVEALTPIMKVSDARVEAAARAIDALWSDGDERQYPFEQTESSYRDHCRSTARAALEAALAIKESAP